MGGYSSWATRARLADLIDLLIECHPQGLGVLLGEVPPPSPKEIHAMLNARRSCDDAGVPTTSPSHVTEAERIVWDKESFDRTVAEAGGWGHIIKNCREYRENAKNEWGVVVDHAKYIKRSASRIDEPRLARIARKHGITKNTVLRYRREFPFKLASAIMMVTPDGTLALRSW